MANRTSLGGGFQWDSDLNKIIKQGFGGSITTYELTDSAVPQNVREEAIRRGYTTDPAVPVGSGDQQSPGTNDGTTQANGETPGFASSLYNDLFSNLPPAMQDLLRKDKDTQREFMAALAGASISESLATRAEQRQEKKAEEAKQSRSAFITGQSPLLSGEKNMGAQLARQGGGFTNFDSAGMRSTRAGAGGAGLLAQGKEGSPDEGTVGSANQPINNFRTTMNVLREQRGY